MKKFIVNIVFCMAVSACSLQSSFAADPTVAERDALSNLMRHQDIPLKKAKYCDGAGPFADEKTIGDYFSSIWSWHVVEDAKNTIDISMRKLKNNNTFVLIMVISNHKEYTWSQGVSFEMDNNKKVLRDSFACVGSG